MLIWWLQPQFSSGTYNLRSNPGVRPSFSSISCTMVILTILLDNQPTNPPKGITEMLYITAGSYSITWRSLHVRHSFLIRHIYWYFQNVFALDFRHFQCSNTKWKGGTNSCRPKLFVILKLKTYLIFIGGIVVRSVCHYWLIDIDDFIYIFKQKSVKNVFKKYFKKKQ